MHYSIPIASRLFSGIGREEGTALMDRFGSVVRKFKKGSLVIREGDPKTHIGILLDGQLEIFEMDDNGCRSVVSAIYPPNCFALTFAFSRIDRHPATVKAVTDSVAMMVPINRLVLHPDEQIDPVYCRFMNNLVSEVCEVAWLGRFRAYVLSRRSTSSRVMAYFRAKARTNGSASFSIPFDRNGLADYLCVDRSALSTVLGKLAREGKLQYRKNRFTLLRSVTDLDL